MKTALRRFFFGLRTECAWCGVLLRRRGLFGQLFVSHGICRLCAAKQLVRFPHKQQRIIHEVIEQRGRPRFLSR
jgi:hypothetical protein